MWGNLSENTRFQSLSATRYAIKRVTSDVITFSSSITRESDWFGEVGKESGQNKIMTDDVNGIECSKTVCVLMSFLRARLTHVYIPTRQ